MHCTVSGSRQTISIDSIAVDILDHSSVIANLNFCTDCPNNQEIQPWNYNAKKEGTLEYF